MTLANNKCSQIKRSFCEKIVFRTFVYNYPGKIGVLCYVLTIENVQTMMHVSRNNGWKKVLNFFYATKSTFRTFAAVKFIVMKALLKYGAFCTFFAAWH